MKVSEKIDVPKKSTKLDEKIDDNQPNEDSDSEIFLDTRKRDKGRKKKNKKRLKILQKALAYEQERLEEEENRKQAVEEANKKHEKDDEEEDRYPTRSKTNRLSIRLDK